MNESVAICTGINTARHFYRSGSISACAPMTVSTISGKRYPTSYAEWSYEIGKRTKLPGQEKLTEFERGFMQARIDLLTRPLTLEQLEAAWAHVRGHSYSEARRYEMMNACVEAKLSPAEQRVFLAFCTTGEGNRYLGQRLGLTESTVKLHLYRAMRKLSCNNRCQLIVWYYRHYVDSLT